MSPLPVFLPTARALRWLYSLVSFGFPHSTRFAPDTTVINSTPNRYRQSAESLSRLLALLSKGSKRLMWNNSDLEERLGTIEEILLEQQLRKQQEEGANKVEEDAAKEAQAHEDRFKAIQEEVDSFIAEKKEKRVHAEAEAQAAREAARRDAETKADSDRQAERERMRKEAEAEAEAAAAAVLERQRAEEVDRKIAAAVAQTERECDAKIAEVPEAALRMT
ncbi:uncharacterized protein BKCO1_3000163 [Diplodia corticola]|uniref:Uncharacterized protein n=1 Tax=Diplodia corticola TaxID=236234 RepID=A0A1J9RF55_9PEZI|nr:uncharacterized protein BKCO1_3000163 [Diplodia corticola]OJD39049.1 hypothetical protein BKCO1_3000163 [Diplodia corticola]